MSSPETSLESARKVGDDRAEVAGGGVSAATGDHSTCSLLLEDLQYQSVLTAETLTHYYGHNSLVIAKFTALGLGFLLVNHLLPTVWHCGCQGWGPGSGPQSDIAQQPLDL